ncbi:MAG: glutamate--tRNA ligase [Patescibacteria group bacterium]
MEKIVKNKKIRVRFAPSPTGFLHIGGARTALINYLFAKSMGGKLILRIEDTDRKRFIEGSTDDIVKNLKWLSINWEEGPNVGGNFGPYFQSERLSLYNKYAEKLVESGKAYYCFCSLARLDMLKKTQIAQGRGNSNYDGRCRYLTLEQVSELKKAGKKHIIRFKAPKTEKIKINDLLKGEIEFSNFLDDFVIIKSDGYPTYHLASVVDDHLMEISHVIRGEEWISSLPKHILLYKSFDWALPNFIHLPVILSPNGGKLSKRDGAVGIKDFQEKGYLPEALINFIAFLGWNPGGEKEIYSLDDLIKSFSLERVQKGGAIFNIQKLDYLNGFYIRQLPIEKLAELCLPYLKEGVDVKHLQKIVSVYQERLKKLSEIKEFAGFFFNDIEYDRGLLKWKDMSDKEIEQSLENSKKILEKIENNNWNKENLEDILMPEAEKGKDRGQLLWPLRTALTGQKASAGPFDVAAILGREKTLERIKKAIELLD